MSRRQITNVASLPRGRHQPGQNAVELGRFPAAAPKGCGLWAGVCLNWTILDMDRLVWLLSFRAAA